MNPYVFIVGWSVQDHRTVSLAKHALGPTQPSPSGCALDWEPKPDGSFVRLHPRGDEEPLDSQALLLEEGF
jgi:hypothetical protein